MKKTLLLLLLSIFMLLTALNYAAAISYARNEDALINIIKKGKSSKIKLGDIDKHCEYGLAEKLIKIILANKERLLEKPCLNPEVDVTDKDAMLKEGKTIPNQTTYLRKAGINPEKMQLGKSPEDTINNTLKDSRMVYYTSLADIDSDGTDEIRFHSVQGTLLEEDNYFFKKETNGKYRLIENDLGADKMVIFVKFKKITYTIERNMEDKLSYLKVYTFNDKTENFENLFTIDIKYEGQKGKSVSLTIE